MGDGPRFAGEATTLGRGEVLVVGSPAALAQEVYAGRHALRVDEPVEAGGTDTGPGPYSLLLASLGACTSMTVGLYAKRKGWPLEGVEVLLRHGKSYLQDCQDCEKDSAKITRIERRIHFIGPLDEAQRGRLMEIADRCPVHRTLTSEIRIDSLLV